MAAPFGFNDEVYREIYPGWDRTAAQADWNAVGERKWADYQRRQNPTAEDIANQVMRAAQEQVEREKAFLEDYTTNNPFVFDEELARQSATAQFGEYYDQLLADYTADIEMQRETIQDEGNLLRTMKKLDIGDKTRSYQRAVRSAQEGFEGAGLFFSGVAKRELGEAEVEQKSDMTRLEESYGVRERGLGRERQGLDLRQSIKERELGSERSEAIEGGVLQREREAETQYYTPLVQSYFRQFPGSGGQSLQGYVLPEYLRY